MADKKCKVVTLRTDEAENAIVGYSDRSLFFEFRPDAYFTRAYLQSILSEAKHIYILSDDIPENGDWVIPNNLENPFCRCPYEFKKAPCPLPYWGAESTCKKIIATTNKSLKLPKPSNEFVQKYISEYNRKNILTEVLVEYSYDTDRNVLVPKLNLKDNTITIKKIKDSWTKDEVTKLLDEAIAEAISFPEHFVTGICCDQTLISNWIKKRL